MAALCPSQVVLSTFDHNSRSLFISLSFSRFLTIITRPGPVVLRRIWSLFVLLVTSKRLAVVHSMPFIRPSSLFRAFASSIRRFCFRSPSLRPNIIIVHFISAQFASHRFADRLHNIISILFFQSSLLFSSLTCHLTFGRLLCFSSLALTSLRSSAFIFAIFVAPLDIKSPFFRPSSFGSGRLG
jgi:hypothetical protein